MRETEDKTKVNSVAEEQQTHKERAKFRSTKRKKQEQNRKNMRKEWNWGKDKKHGGCSDSK